MEETAGETKTQVAFKKATVSGGEWKCVKVAGGVIRCSSGVSSWTSPVPDIYQQLGHPDSAADNSEEVCGQHEAGAGAA